MCHAYFRQSQFIKRGSNLLCAYFRVGELRRRSIASDTLPSGTIFGPLSAVGFVFGVTASKVMCHFTLTQRQAPLRRERGPSTTYGREAAVRQRSKARDHDHKSMLGHGLSEHLAIQILYIPRRAVLVASLPGILEGCGWRRGLCGYYRPLSSDCWGALSPWLQTRSVSGRKSSNRRIGLFVKRRMG